MADLIKIIYFLNISMDAYSGSIFIFNATMLISTILISSIIYLFKGGLLPKFLNADKIWKKYLRHFFTIYIISLILEAFSLLILIMYKDELTANNDELIAVIIKILIVNLLFYKLILTLVTIEAVSFFSVNNRLINLRTIFLKRGKQLDV